MKKRRQEQGGENLGKRREDHSGMETDISETGNIGMKGETRGDRDEQRSVGDVTEIGTDLGNGKV